MPPGDRECAPTAVVEWPDDHEGAVLHGVGEGALPQLTDRSSDARAVAVADEIGILVVVEFVVKDERVADGISLVAEIDDRFVGHVLDERQ